MVDTYFSWQAGDPAKLSGAHSGPNGPGAAVGRITGPGWTSATLPARSLALGPNVRTTFLLISARSRPESLAIGLPPCGVLVGPPVSLF
jgi:hypothetical protein